MTEVQSSKNTRSIGYYIVTECEVVVGFADQVKDIVRKKLIVIDLVSDSEAGVAAAGLTGVCVYVDKVRGCRGGIQPRRKKQGRDQKRKKFSQS